MTTGEVIALIKAFGGGSGGGGTGGGVLVVHIDENLTLDKTWQEIHDAALVGGVVLVGGTSSSFTVDTLCSVGEDGYVVSFASGMYGGYSTFVASSASGYPVYQAEG